MKRFLYAAVLLVCTAATGAAQDIPLSKILVEGEGWKLVAKDVPEINHLRGEVDGTVVIYQKVSRTKEITPTGQVKNAPQMSGGIELGDSSWVHGRLHRYLVHPKEMTIEVIAHRGENETQTVKLNGLTSPSCVTLWPDESQLVVGGKDTAWLWAMRVEADGKLGHGDRYYSLRTKPGQKTTRVTAIVMDAGYLLYAATPLGVQVFDPTGRLCGVILPPAKEEMTAITLGGKDANTLYVACGDKIYSRKIQGKAAYTLKKDK